MTAPIPDRLLAEVRAADARIKAAAEPMEKAAAMAAGREVEARCAPHLRAYAAEEAIRKAHAAPVTLTKARP